MRKSKQKDIILRALEEYKVHPTADELYKYIHQEHDEIGVATVYRNLNRFTEKGIIKKIIGLDGSSHFDSCINPHYHFICNCCGKIYDIPGDIGKNLISKAEEFTDCKIISVDITFRGLCRKCEDIHNGKFIFDEKETEMILNASTS